MREMAVNRISFFLEFLMLYEVYSWILLLKSKLTFIVTASTSKSKLLQRYEVFRILFIHWRYLYVHTFFHIYRSDSTYKDIRYLDTAIISTKISKKKQLHIWHLCCQKLSIWQYWIHSCDFGERRVWQNVQKRTFGRTFGRSSGSKRKSRWCRLTCFPLSKRR